MEQQNQELVVQNETAIVPTKANAVINIMTNKPIIPLAVIGGLLVTAILFIILFIVSSSDKRAAEATIAEQDEKIATISAEVKEVSAEAKDARALAAAYKLDADRLEAIYDFMLSPGAGEANYKFKVDKPIIVLRKSDPRKTVQLTTAYNTSYWFEYSEEGVAFLEFNVERWSGTTVQLNATALDTGMTVVTFHNEANLETFKMMIIVLD